MIAELTGMDLANSSMTKH
ncbi:hypothetical protein CGLO_11176 [Colletotrichum gloeosporioides Cg-14]|uniref:Uncharacterized protein n=1 Tax=Colletotrichum gloeosporioides (strain Cg-14) TaxID=1237896 RepID=T0K1J9_COLGC|nr:hypothetical protein CGLO_11176 [Colletotrichum gloeosporioides Cg-14]